MPYLWSCARLLETAMRRSKLLLLLLCACTNTAQREPPPGNGQLTPPPTQEVFVYRACEFAAPGELVALPREVPGSSDPTAAALGELMRGPTEEERDRGCTSFFSSQTESALQGVYHSTGGDTIVVDFHDFSGAIPNVMAAKSFLPPGVMAELTWTIFHQFPEIEAARFAFDGDEGAFWSWVGGEGTEPQVYTRSMWERI